MKTQAQAAGIDLRRLPRYAAVYAMKDVNERIPAYKKLAFDLESELFTTKAQRDLLASHLRFAIKLLGPLAGHTAQVETMRAALKQAGVA